MHISVFLALCSLPPLAVHHSIIEMKSDLQLAENELQVAHSKILHLKEAIARKEISRIQKEVETFDGNDEERLDFLDLSRKNIASIMSEVPSCIIEAQSVLDEILIAITDLKERGAGGAAPPAKAVGQA